MRVGLVAAVERIRSRHALGRRPRAQAKLADTRRGRRVCRSPSSLRSRGDALSTGTPRSSGGEAVERDLSPPAERQALGATSLTLAISPGNSIEAKANHVGKEFSSCGLLSDSSTRDCTARNLRQQRASVHQYERPSRCQSKTLRGPAGWRLKIQAAIRRPAIRRPARSSKIRAADPRAGCCGRSLKPGR